jgi:membrane-associated phospholipid phosphatase
MCCLAEVTRVHQLSSVDRTVNAVMSQLPAWIVVVSNGLHYLFSVASLLAVTVALAFVFGRRIGRAQAVLITGLMVSGAVVNQLVKFLVARPRPADALIPLADSAFPSGHTSATAIFFGILSITLLPRTASSLGRALILCASALLVGVVGFSRLALRVHWLTDVAAGLALGGFVVSVGVILQVRASPLRKTR